MTQVDNGIRIKKEAMTIINDFMIDVFERLASEASRLAHLRQQTVATKNIILTSRELQTAVRFVLPGELGRHAQSEGAKAMKLYLDNE